MRRYEQMTVHQAMQGMSVAGLPWLPRPHGTPPSGSGAAQRGGAAAAAEGGEGVAAAAVAARGEEWGWADGEVGAGGAGGAAAPSPTGREREQRRQHVPSSLHAYRQRLLALWLGWLFMGGRVRGWG